MLWAKSRVWRWFPRKEEFWSAPIPVMGLWMGCTLLKTQAVRSAYFSLTEFIEGVKRQSFFDNFLSFSGWCGVRGSSEVTFLTERMGKRASEGL